MNSMTGYGYEELVEEKLFLSVEIKSYNSRFLDLSINLPSSLSRLENFFREKVTAAVVRGKVDVYIRLREEEPATTVLVNQEAVRSYAAAIAQVSQMLSEMQGAAGSQVASTSQSQLELILGQEGVLVSHREFDLDSYKALLEPVFDGALEQFLADRRREGENLKVDLQEKLAVLEDEANILAPKLAELVRLHFRNVLPADNDISRAGGVKPRAQVDKGAFSGAGGSNDRNELAVLNLYGNLIYGRHGLFGLLV